MARAYTQHEKEIAETKLCWDRKPLLRIAYRNFHSRIQEQLLKDPGLTVELGSGIGCIKETIPNCITTDINQNPFVDQVEDAYALSFADKSVANLILFDVWHHLEFPGSALKEFHRVLTEGGRVIIFDPAALSLLGRLVFGLLHHEPIHSSSEPKCFIPEGLDPKKLDYFAAQGNAWKMFYRRELPVEILYHWNCSSIQFFPAFEWLAAGGFRARQIAPTCLHHLLQAFSKIFALCPSIFATRMLIVLKKSDDDRHNHPTSG